MSEIEIAPLYEVGFVSPMNFGGFCAQFYAPTRVERGTKLYGQAAIDHLSTKLKHYRMAAEAEASLADRRQKEIDRLCDDLAEYQANLTAESDARIRLESERDAALADAAALRERMVVLEKQRDDAQGSLWRAEKAKQKAEAARDRAQEDANRYRILRDKAALPVRDVFDARWLRDNGNPETLDVALDIFASGSGAKS